MAPDPEGAPPTTPEPADEHVPVLLARCLELLEPALARAEAVAVDATLGLGGHTEAMLRGHPALTVVGLDRDPQALARAEERLARFGDRFRPVRCVYDELPAALAGQGFVAADAILFDLGVSSMQLDRPERGFAYAQDSPLDMRMDQSSGRTAADVLNTAPVDELARILREYGDERLAGQIARAVVRERERAPFTTSGRLVDLIRATIPAPARRTGGNPAKRTFQALRIAVNGELESVEKVLPLAMQALAPGGRLAVIAFHSLEDRIVKEYFRRESRDCLCPPRQPQCTCGHKATIIKVTRKPIIPSETEVKNNPRARSAKLRIAEKI